jgi:hypothetical protein
LQDQTAARSHPADPGRYWRRRFLVLIGVICLLVVQAMYAERSQPEPYPAFVLPPFQTTTVDGVVVKGRILVSVTFQDGTTLTPSVATVFRRVHFASISGTVKYAFSPKVAGSQARITPEVVRWLRAQVSTMHPTSRPESITLCWTRAVIHVRGPREQVRPCDYSRKIEL